LDEPGGTTMAAIDSRSRVVSDVHPAGDDGLFVYDDRNKTAQHAGMCSAALDCFIQVGPVAINRAVPAGRANGC